MADNLGYTPGSGATVRTKEVAAGIHLPLIDTPIRDGRTPWMAFAEAVAGAAAEALISMTIATAIGTAGSASTIYTVPAGKILRIQSIVAVLIATTTTANSSRLRMRAVATGTAVIGSPILVSFPRMGFESATFIANESSAPLVMPIADGFELPAGTSFGFTHLEAAANGTIDLLVKGFLYNAP